MAAKDRTSKASQELRKPWGGQLGAPRTGREQPSRERAFAAFGLLVRKFAELSLLAVLLAVPFTYHFAVSFGAIGKLRESLQGLGFQPGYFFQEQLIPFITGGMPVLESKFTAWYILGSLTIAGYASARFLEGFSHRPVLEDSIEGTMTSRGSRYRMIPLLCLAGFLGWSLLSLLFWPPAMPEEATALLGKNVGNASGLLGRIGTELGGGGFYYSMVAWLQIVFVAVFFLACEDLLRRRRLVYKVLAVIVAAGFINAVVVILQKVEFPPIANIWVRFGENDARNRLGAFIGHNTGVSSFLIAPFLISLTWLLTRQPNSKETWRLTLAIGVTFCALALILAQSRAVIPILGAAFLLLMAILYRKSCLPPRSRLYIWFPVTMVFLLLTQLIPHQYNPLFREDVTLSERVKDFKTEKLLTETRLRIGAVCLTQLVPQSPILGHGFASFQYVYPRAQGEYFRENPRSLLAPTMFRTQRAHNEYLQTLVETGFVGIAFVAVGLFYLLRGGWLVLRRTLLPNHIAVQAAIFCALLALLAHCFVDFPMRIPPLTITIVVLFAIWSAGDRLWVFPMQAPRPEAIPTVEDPENPVEPEKTKESTLPVWCLPLGMATLVVICAGQVFLSAAVINRFQSGSTLSTRGESAIQGFSQNTEDTRFLSDAYDLLRAARRVVWISGPVNRLNSVVQYLVAQNQYLQADQLAQAEKFELANAARASARTHADAALTDINMSLAEEYLQNSFMQRSDIHNLIASNALGAERQEHFERRNDDLERAARINPGNPYVLIKWIDVLDKRPKGEDSDLYYYLGVLQHFHPKFFRENVFQRVLDALYVGYPEDANSRLRTIVKAVPHNMDYYQILAGTELAAGHLDEATLIAGRILESGDHAGFTPLARDNARMVLAQVAAREGDTRRALEYLSRISTDDPAIQGISQAMQLYLLNDDAEKAKIRDEIIKRGEDKAMFNQFAGVVAFEQFAEYSDAVFWLEKRSQQQPPMDLQGYLILAQAYAKLEEWDKMRAAIAKIGTLDLDTYVRTLTERTLKSLEEAAPPVATEEEPQ